MQRGLHINSYFLTNKIHYRFYKKIRALKDDAFIIPVYKRFRKSNEYTDVDIDFVYSWIDKSIFTKVLKVILIYFQRRYSRNAFDYIHGHTLISDGLPAYVLSVMTKTKFFLTVRSSDVDFFIEKSWVFRKIGKFLLKRADKIFFVSPAYVSKIKKKIPLLDISNFHILPNGIEDYWIANKREKKSKKEFTEINILFVGQIIDRKRLDLLIDLANKYTDRRYVINVVGKNINGTNFEQVNEGLPKSNSVIYHGQIKRLDSLAKIYSENDVFIMLSHSETFGVVYIEALSQGLPIIYTKGDGVYGYFSEGTVGYSCSQDVNDLKSTIDKLVLNYDEIVKSVPKEVDKFNWDVIVQQYINFIEA